MTEEAVTGLELDGNAEYILADTWSEKKPGYVFTNGKHGQGYYLDRDEINKLKKGKKKVTFKSTTSTANTPAVETMSPAGEPTASPTAKTKNLSNHTLNKAHATNNENAKDEEKEKEMEKINQSGSVRFCNDLVYELD